MRRAVGAFALVGTLVVACGAKKTEGTSGAGGVGGTSSPAGGTDETAGSSSARAGGPNPDGGSPALGGASAGTGPLSAGGTSGVGAASAAGGTRDTGGAPGSGGVTGGRVTCKRGVAYGHHSVADMTALSAGVAWWYNWAFLPDEEVRDGEYATLEVEYAPMIWGAGTDRTAAATSIPDGARALLGFNEPNFGSQANMSASEAAALWPELEAIADARNLKLVSPAVNFCGGDCWDTDPFDYLDDFFAACSNCRVDAVAIHIYVACNPTGDNHAQWLINHIETYKSRFSEPLWLTEFACDSATSEAEQLAFLQDAVAYLENEPRIERYAWFSGRADNVAHVDLLGSDGELTALGQAYVNAPQPASCAR